MKSNREWWGLWQTRLHAPLKGGSAFLSLYLPAVSMWEHRPNAARSSNILRGTKRPDTIYISQLLSDYN